MTREILQTIIAGGAGYPVCFNYEEISHLRGHTIGFIFQYHLLISAFTARENVMMPMLVDRGFPNVDIEARASELLAQVGFRMSPTISRTTCQAASSNGWRSRTRCSS
jgi:ABC-type lipoprotein export system ATPase subunit